MKKSVAVVLTAVSVVGAGLIFRHFVNPYEKVYKIADGDTFILEQNKQTVRLYCCNYASVPKAPDPTG